MRKQSDMILFLQDCKFLEISSPKYNLIHLRIFHLIKLKSASPSIVLITRSIVCSQINPNIVAWNE